ncbi:uncharacterized protein LOC120941310 [Rana temporaria]|uniref:uncharacterized protein LOC120941310 n=1 Tax=Rana temporaria TaxID=8407 RepID=UPI001AAD6802|nr:uncharacterized protein LOC120941310 [Rana temporaria]
MRDAFKKYNKHLREVRSGSGAPARVPYMYAEDLAFLKPLIEMRETEASWDEQDVLEDQPESQSEAQSVPAVCIDPNEEIPEMPLGSDLWVTNPETDSGLPEPMPGPSSAPTTIARPAKVARKRTPVSQMDISERLLEMLQQMAGKVDAFLCPATILALNFVPLIKKVLPERYLEMRTTVEHVLQSFTVPSEQHTLERPYVTKETTHIHLPMSGQYPDPGNQPYPYVPPSYTSSFQEPTSIYEVQQRRTAYPIPSPIPSIMPQTQMQGMYVPQQHGPQTHGLDACSEACVLALQTMVH